MIPFIGMAVCGVILAVLVPWAAKETRRNIANTEEETS